MFKLMFLLLALTVSPRAFAQAKSFYLVRVMAEATGDRVEYVGVNLDSDHSIRSIVFREANGNSKSYTLQELKSPKTLLQYRGFDIVNFYADTMADGSIELNFSYLHNAYSPVHRRRSKSFVIRANPSRPSGYEVVNEDTLGVITQLFALTNRMGKVPCGIDEIQAK